MGLPDGAFAIFNDDTADLPAGALCRWTGGFTARGELRVKRPNAANMPSLVVAGSFAIPKGAAGVGSFAPRAQVAFDPAGGAPAQGDALGSVAGSWYAKKGNTGFRCFGGSALAWADCVRESGATTPPRVVRANLAVKAGSLPAFNFNNPSGDPTNRVGATITRASNGNAGALIDGSGYPIGYRILVHTTLNTIEGVYVVTQQGSASTPYIFTVAADMDTAAEMDNTIVLVQEGNYGPGNQIGTANRYAAYAPFGPGPGFYNYLTLGRGNVKAAENANVGTVPNVIAKFINATSPDITRSQLGPTYDATLDDNGNLSTPGWISIPGVRFTGGGGGPVGTLNINTSGGSTLGADVVAGAFVTTSYFGYRDPFGVLYTGIDALGSYDPTVTGIPFITSKARWRRGILVDDGSGSGGAALLASPGNGIAAGVYSTPGSY